MADTAESVVVSIEARTDGFTPAVTQATTAFTSSMSAVEQSATRAEGAVRTAAGQIVQHSSRMGASGMELQHVLRGSLDQFAAGAPPLRIFAQHIAMLGEAAELSGNSMGRFGAFLQGPWGMALVAGTAILSVLISKMSETTDVISHEIEKLGENATHADLVRVAHENFAHTLPGIIQAIREETAALEDQNRSLAQNEQLALDHARERLRSLQEQQQIAQRDLADARAALSQAQSASVGRGTTGTHDFEALTPSTAVTDAERRIAELEHRLSVINAGIAAAPRDIRLATIPIAVREAEAMVDPIQRINDRYTAMIDSMRAQAAANDRLTATLATRLAAVRRLQEAELDAERARQHAAPRERDLVRPTVGAVLSQFGADRSGVPLNGHLVPGRRHEGVDLRGATGDPVVAPESGIATVRNAPGGLGLYVEIRADSGARDLLGHLSAANIQSGDRVAAGQLVGLIGNSGNARGGQPHLHWQRQVGGQWVDPMRSVGSSGAAQEAEQEVRRQRALAESRTRDEEKFQHDLATLNTDLLRARRHAVQTEEEQAAADVAAINAERDQRNQRYRSEAEDHSRHDEVRRATYEAERDQLIAQSNLVAQAQADQRMALERQRLDEQRLTIAVGDLHDAASIVQAHAALADTLRERRDLELRLLALQHQEEILAIEKQRRLENLTADQLSRLDREEAAANTRYSLAQESTRHSTMGPLEQFLDQAPNSAGKLDEALQGIASHGLTALNDGLAQAVTSFIHLGGVAGQIVNQMISDLVRLLVYRNITAPLAGMLNGLFGGGGGIGTAANPAPFLGFLPGFATGGVFDIGGNGGIDRNVLSINGQPRAMVSADEKIAVIPQGKALAFGGGQAASGAGAGVPQRVTIAIQSTGDFEAKVTEIAGHVAVEIGRAAAPQIIAGAKAETLRAITRPGLNRN